MTRRDLFKRILQAAVAGLAAPRIALELPQLPVGGPFIGVALHAAKAREFVILELSHPMCRCELAPHVRRGDEWVPVAERDGSKL